MEGNIPYTAVIVRLYLYFITPRKRFQFNAHLLLCIRILSVNQSNGGRRKMMLFSLSLSLSSLFCL